MKTKATLSGSISNTLSKGIVVLTFLFSFPFLSVGQSEKENNLYTFTKDGVLEYDLTSFVAKYAEGKVYIMFAAVEPSDESIYTIERSSNDKTYERLATIKGVKSPGEIALLNSFVDNEPLTNSSYYKIKRYSNDDVTVSSAIAVRVPKVFIDIASH